jgi:hypothetical protein
MRPPIIGTALPIAAAILIAWSLALGAPTDTGIEWVARTMIVYPLCHVAVRSYRQRQQAARHRHR